MVNLREIRNAVVDYIDNRVKPTFKISPIGNEKQINPGEKFNIVLTVTNAAGNPEQAVQLVNVRYRLEIKNPAIAKLIVPSLGVGTTSAGIPGKEVAAMLLNLTPNNDRLLEGETQTLTLQGKALAKGSAELAFDVLADPDLNYLFPKSTSTPGFKDNVKVVD